MAWPRKKGRHAVSKFRSHDLAQRLVEASGQTLNSVRITRYSDGQFFAEIVLGGQRLPARASDAIALALRAACPIECAEATTY